MCIADKLNDNRNWMALRETDGTYPSYVRPKTTIIHYNLIMKNESYLFIIGDTKTISNKLFIKLYERYKK